MTIDEARALIPRARLKLSTRIVPADEGGDGKAEADVVEVWWCDQMVMSIYVGRSPSVNIVTKHQMVVMDNGRKGDPLASLGVLAHVEPPEDVAEAMRVVMRHKLGNVFELLTKAQEAVAPQSNVTKVDPITKHLLTHLGGGDKGKMN